MLCLWNTSKYSCQVNLIIDYIFIHRFKRLKRKNMLTNMLLLYKLFNQLSFLDITLDSK